jgi:glycosyltransferase involved in cell wall biosynthesis
MLVTVFTPTFNRAHTLPALYRSLTEQTCNDFEWLVVDDGSSDGTGTLLRAMQREGRLAMRVVRTPNGGKHRAINSGVARASGELFFIVDSDDYLTPDALRSIADHWAAVAEDPGVAGLCLRKANYTTGEVIGGQAPVAQGDYTSLEIIHRLGVTGDKAEVFRTRVLAEHPFPEIGGEKFVPEALVWNRIGRRYKLRFVDRVVYMCDYLSDGLSRNFRANLRRNPRGFALYYRELLFHRGVPSVMRLKALMRLAQCGVYKKNL